VVGATPSEGFLVLSDRIGPIETSILHQRRAGSSASVRNSMSVGHPSALGLWTASTDTDTSPEVTTGTWRWNRCRSTQFAVVPGSPFARVTCLFAVSHSMQRTITITHVSLWHIIVSANIRPTLLLHNVAKIMADDEIISLLC